MIVAIIEPDKYEWTNGMVWRIQDVITNLVVKYGALVFLFINAGQFDYECYTIVSKLKKLYPSIERHYYHGSCDYDVGYVDWMSEFFDILHFPEKGVVLSRQLRDCAMIDICDVLLTCGNSSAVEYAQTKKKRIINLSEN